MPITISSNIASLVAQRRLAESSDKLQRSFERLSSGLRINRASDDAAGLSVATTLNASVRIATQGIRNLNDGISALTIAGGAAQEMSSVLIRIQELATQSANGTYSNQQRTAMNTEAQQLRLEFNRIISTTKFNGISLLDGSMNGTTIQGGERGQETALSMDKFAIAGDGTFGEITTVTQNANHGYSISEHPLMTVDINKDGNLDMVSQGIDNMVTVMLGNGDGTFRAKVQYTSGGNGLAIGDVNGDGNLDVLSTDSGGDRFAVLLGNGDGTLRALTWYGVGDDTRGIALGDFNGDGRLDVVTTADVADDSIRISFGNGNGTFSYGTSFASGDDPKSVSVGDINGDGKLDIVSVSQSDGYVSVYFGNGDGTLRARVSYFGATNAAEVSLVDLNQDDRLDIVFGTTSSTNVIMANSDSTYKAPTQIIGLFASDFTTGDFNGDGVTDLVGVAHAGTANAYIAFGNNDGTFRQGGQFSLTNVSGTVVTGDFNGDGVSDLAIEGNLTGNLDIALGNTQAALQGFSLSTRGGALAALPIVQRAIDRLSLQLGKVGAQQSRLGYSLSNITKTRESYARAASQITDVDVAEESAALTSSQIRQQIGAAILAQANSAPSLVLELLKSP